jgi:hypothetical protein
MKKVLVAWAASNDLDPFYFDVDLDCEDPQTPRRRSNTAKTPPEDESS